MTDEERLAVAAEYAAATRSGDLEALATVREPDAVVWHNHDDQVVDRDQSDRMLGWLHRNVEGLDWVDVAMTPTADGFLWRAILVGMTPSGPLRVHTCMVVTLSSNGRVARTDEYLDSARGGRPDLGVAMVLSSEEQQRRRDRFRRHWQEGVAFNKACAIEVRRWDAEGVELHLPYRDDLSAHTGIFHGGVLSALIDTAGCGAVAAGHDYDKGSRISTLALSVQFLTVARGEDVVAYARCSKRGRAIHYADVVVRSTSGRELAQGLVTVSVSGERRGVIG